MVGRAGSHVNESVLGVNFEFDPIFFQLSNSAKGAVKKHHISLLPVLISCSSGCGQLLKRDVLSTVATRVQLLLDDLLQSESEGPSSRADKQTGTHTDDLWSKITTAGVRTLGGWLTGQSRASRIVDSRGSTVAKILTLVLSKTHQSRDVQT